MWNGCHETYESSSSSISISSILSVVIKNAQL